MRYYAIIGAMDPPKKKSWFNFFINDSFSAEKAKDFFYKSNDKLFLFTTFEEAKIYAADMPNSWKTAPIYEVETAVGSSLPTSYSTGEYKFSHPSTHSRAQKYGVSTQNSPQSSTRYSFERKDIDRLIAVHIFSENAEQKYIELNGLTSNKHSIF